MKRRLAAVASLVTVAGCTDAEGPVVAPLARPVTVVTLRDELPELPGRLSGVAVPYRQAEIGFEVAGRIALVQDVGLEVQGATEDRTGQVVEQGDVIALLDPKRHQQKLRAAELALAAEQKALEVQELEVATILRSELEQSEAQLDVAGEEVHSAESNEEFAASELSRMQGLVQQGVVTESEYDRVHNDLETATAALQATRSRFVAAEASVRTAQNQIKIRQAQAERTRALVAEKEQDIVQALTDLEDCTLTAPFNSRITERHFGRGDYVRPGTAVVTLTMMDPIKLVVMTSADKSRRLLTGTQVTVLPEDLRRFTETDGLPGTVIEKAEVADSSTRTFKVEVIFRNLKSLPSLLLEDGSRAASIDRLFPAVGRDASNTGPLFVHPDCVIREGHRDLVYRLPGFKLGRVSREQLYQVLYPEALPVQLLDEFFTVSMTLQRVSDDSGLEGGDLLIRSPRPEHLKGSAMVAGDWVVRPGDIIPAVFDLGEVVPGYYVPAEAIRTLNGRASVFVVDSSDCARKLEVTVHETLGLQRRIDGKDLKAGVRVVLQGLHYVADGETVRVVEQIGL